MKISSIKFSVEDGLRLLGKLQSTPEYKEIKSTLEPQHLRFGPGKFPQNPDAYPRCGIEHLDRREFSQDWKEQPTLSVLVKMLETQDECEFTYFMNSGWQKIGGSMRDEDITSSVSLGVHNRGSSLIIHSYTIAPDLRHLAAFYQECADIMGYPIFWSVNGDALAAKVGNEDYFVGDLRFDYHRKVYDEITLEGKRGMVPVIQDPTYNIPAYLRIYPGPRSMVLPEIDKIVALIDFVSSGQEHYHTSFTLKVSPANYEALLQLLPSLSPNPNWTLEFHTRNAVKLRDFPQAITQSATVILNEAFALRLKAGKVTGGIFFDENQISFSFDVGRDYKREMALVRFMREICGRDVLISPDEGTIIDANEYS